MLPIIKFGLEKIHASPHQDRQYSFKLIRVTRPTYPVKRTVQLYHAQKPLPNQTDSFHVYTIGNISPKFLNLLKQKRDWFKDRWINVEEDMNSRNYMLQVYNQLGLSCPRSNIYYSFIDESSIIIAIRVTSALRRVIDIESMTYIRFYSNEYFRTPEFVSSGKPGIRVFSTEVNTNQDKVNLQTQIASLKNNGGDVLVYVNGYYTSNLTLHIPNFSLVEVLYDNSITSKEIYSINTLRTFDSTKDNKLKYLIFRNKTTEYFQYSDDIDFYIINTTPFFNKGVFYYKHKEFASRNVTDKDYSLFTDYVNNQANHLSSVEGGSIQDKNVVVITRRSGVDNSLIYSSLKLHELYKLPQAVELDVLSNMNYTIPELRAEQLENSDYFKLVDAKSLRDVTNSLCSSAVGYAGIKYYFANSPIHSITEENIEVPELYQYPSLAYEYNAAGVLINIAETIGPIYTRSSSLVRSVEFIRGRTPSDYNKLYSHNETVTLRNAEFIILSAYFDGINRITEWEDITNNSSLVTIRNSTLSLSEGPNKKIKIVYLDQPITYTLEYNLSGSDGIMYFPITIREDRGTGLMQFPIDIPFTSVDVFLNGYKLEYRVGYFIDYPYISICDKEHIDYTKVTQTIHVRVHGLPTTKSKINSNHLTGFISHGVLSRNNLYDIRDDRVYSVYIAGRLHNRNNVRYAEEDNTVRVSDTLNGLPYSIVEHELSTKEITGLPTTPLYLNNLSLNKKISDLYNIIYKEPTIDPFNIIGSQYFLFSPTICKIIEDMLDGNIPSRIYTNPYTDVDIFNLLETRYKILYNIDPVRANLPTNLIEIHPHSGNTVVDINLHQYRFITRVIHVLTNGNSNRVNISGYLGVISTNDDTVTFTGFVPSGIPVV